MDDRRELDWAGRNEGPRRLARTESHDQDSDSLYGWSHIVGANHLGDDGTKLCADLIQRSRTLKILDLGTFAL